MSSTKRHLSGLAVMGLLLALPATVAAQGYGSVNLARGKPVTPLTNTVRGGPQGIVDGSYDGYTGLWYSLQCSGWAPCLNQFTIDLGAEYAIGKINVWPLQTHAFRVLSSPDGTTWTERHNYNWILSTGFYLGGGSPPLNLLPNGSYSARFLKYEGMANWYQYVGVYELEVFEWVASPSPEADLTGLPNLALGRPATDYAPTFTSVPGRGPGLLTDGNVATYWQGNYSGDQCGAAYQASCPLGTWYTSYGWAYVDLGEPREVQAIRVRFPEGVPGAQTFMVSLTDNTSTWFGVNKFVGLWGDPAMVASRPAVTTSAEHTFYLNAPQTARYVWINTNTWFTEGRLLPTVAEVEVYGALPADPDTDGDGVLDSGDNCPTVANPDQLNTDGDDRGDACDADDDNDGYLDLSDAFPLDASEWQDTDTDGIGNNADPDDDNDGQGDADEMSCGSNPVDAGSTSPDLDADGSPDCVDNDADGDGVANAIDNCSMVANADQLDTDLDLAGNVCDADDDNDLVLDLVDACPLVAAPGSVDGCLPPPLPGPPMSKDECKADGWKVFGVPRAFKNQGDCVSFVVSNKGGSSSKD